MLARAKLIVAFLMASQVVPITVNSSVAGSQYISGAFGKIKMGDLGGADKDAAGHIAGGVGLSGMGSNNEIRSTKRRTHNLGYEFSTNGRLTFGYSQNRTAVANR